MRCIFPSQHLFVQRILKLILLLHRLYISMLCILKEDPWIFGFIVALQIDFGRSEVLWILATVMCKCTFVLLCTDILLPSLAQIHFSFRGYQCTFYIALMRLSMRIWIFNLMGRCRWLLNLFLIREAPFEFRFDEEGALWCLVSIVLFIRNSLLQFWGVPAIFWEVLNYL